MAACDRGGAASRNFTELPVVDVSPLLASGSSNVAGHADERLAETIAQLRDACENVGFFYVKGHGIPQELVDGVRQVAREFFALPLEEKKRIALNGAATGYRGYQPLGENVTKGKRDQHEGVDVMREFGEGEGENSPVRGPNLWPSRPEHFKDVCLEYVSRMVVLGAAIMKGIALGLGEAPDAFLPPGGPGSSHWFLRLIGYPPVRSGTAEAEATKAAEDDVGDGCGEHTDYGMLTAVNADLEPAEALQVQNARGEWVVARPIPGHFVMNIGDMLATWTNGRYRPTVHKVVSSASAYRVSVPFFYEPSYYTVVKPLPSCLQAGEAPRYPEVMYGHHLVSKVTSNFYSAGGQA